MIKLLLTLALVGIGLALKKLTLFGVPIYFLEGVLLCTTPLLLLYKKSWQKIDSWLLVGNGLFVVGAILSTFGHYSGTTSLGQLKSWILFPASFFVFIVTTGYLTNKEKREYFYRALMMGIGFIVIVACYGFYNGVLTYDHRLAFPESSPNFLAFLVAQGLFVALYNLQKSEKDVLRALIWLYILLSLFVLYQTHSYNVFLATIGALTIGVYLQLRISEKNSSLLRSVIFGMTVLGLLSLGVFFLEKDTQKWHNLFLTNNRSSIDSRMMIWQSALRIGEDHSILGIGVGNFQQEYLVYQQYFPPYLEWAVPQPHNIILATWLQTGLLGLLGLSILIGRAFYLLKRVLSKNKKEALLYISLLSFFLLYGLFDTPYFRNDLAFLFWLYLAGIHALYFETEPTNQEESYRSI